MEASCTNRTTRDNVVRNDVALGFDLGGRQGRKANRIGTLKSQINHSILCESGQSMRVGSINHSVLCESAGAWEGSVLRIGERERG